MVALGGITTSEAAARAGGIVLNPGRKSEPTCVRPGTRCGRVGEQDKHDTAPCRMPEDTASARLPGLMAASERPLVLTAGISAQVWGSCQARNSSRTTPPPQRCVHTPSLPAARLQKDPSSPLSPPCPVASALPGGNCCWLVISGLLKRPTLRPHRGGQRGCGSAQLQIWLAALKARREEY